MRRAAVVTIAASAALALAGCSTDAPAPSPSASPDPVGVYDDVDLAPLLLERPFVGFADRGFDVGPWEVRDDPRLIGDLDPALFAADPECEAALERIQPSGVDVIVGGYELQGQFQPRVRVARFATADDASAYLVALDAATAACADVQGEPSLRDASFVIDDPVDTPLADAAGIATFTLDFEGEPRGAMMSLVGARDELVVVMATGFSGGLVPGEDPDLVAAMQAQLDALAAAAP